jgi:hypothetical protein
MNDDVTESRQAMGKNCSAEGEAIGKAKVKEVSVYFVLTDGGDNWK